METPTMGKVLVTAKIENLADLFDAEKGVLSEDQVRRIEVHDAVIDTGATTLLLPKAHGRWRWGSNRFAPATLGASVATSCYRCMERLG